MKVLRTTLWATTIAYWVFIFVMTHIPQVRVPRAPVTDKTAHLVAYFVLGCLLGAAMWAGNPSRRGIALWVLAIGAAYGAIDELTQDLVGRYCELADWAYDVIGAATAAGLIALLRLARGGGGAAAPSSALERG